VLSKREDKVKFIQSLADSCSKEVAEEVANYLEAESKNDVLSKNALAFWSSLSSAFDTENADAISSFFIKGLEARHAFWGLVYAGLQYDLLLGIIDNPEHLAVLPDVYNNLAAISKVSISNQNLQEIFNNINNIEKYKEGLLSQIKKGKKVDLLKNEWMDQVDLHEIINKYFHGDSFDNGAGILNKENRLLIIKPLKYARDSNQAEMNLKQIWDNLKNKKPQISPCTIYFPCTSGHHWTVKSFIYESGLNKIPSFSEGELFDPIDKHQRGDADRCGDWCVAHILNEANKKNALKVGRENDLDNILNCYEKPEGNSYAKADSDTLRDATLAVLSSKASVLEEVKQDGPLQIPQEAKESPSATPKPSTPSSPSGAAAASAAKPPEAKAVEVEEKKADGASPAEEKKAAASKPAAVEPKPASPSSSTELDPKSPSVSSESEIKTVGSHSQFYSQDTKAWLSIIKRSEDKEVKEQLLLEEEKAVKEEALKEIAKGFYRINRHEAVAKFTDQSEIKDSTEIEKFLVGFKSTGKMEIILDKKIDADILKPEETKTRIDKTEIPADSSVLDSKTVKVASVHTVTKDAKNVVTHKAEFYVEKDDKGKEKELSQHQLAEWAAREGANFYATVPKYLLTTKPANLTNMTNEQAAMMAAFCKLKGFKEPTLDGVKISESKKVSPDALDKAYKDMCEWVKNSGNKWVDVIFTQNELKNKNDNNDSGLTSGPSSSIKQINKDGGLEVGPLSAAEAKAVEEAKTAKAEKAKAEKAKAEKAKAEKAKAEKAKAEEPIRRKSVGDAADNNLVDDLKKSDSGGVKISTKAKEEQKEQKEQKEQQQPGKYVRSQSWSGKL